MQDAQASGEQMLDEMFAPDRDRTDDKPPVEAAKPVDPPEQPGLPQPEATPPQPTEEETRVPYAALKEERHKRQELQRLLEESRRRDEHYQAMFAEMQRRQAPPQQPQMPDPYQDPAGYVQMTVAQLEDQFANRLAHMSEMNARQQFGDQACNDALVAAQRAGIVNQFAGHPHPWGALVHWHRQATALNEIGGDLDGYKKRIREEVLAEINGGRRSAPQPGAQQAQFPGSLATATAGGAAPAGGPVTQQAMMDQLFAPTRYAKT